MSELLKLPKYLKEKIYEKIDKNYISKKLTKRKGKCNKCGNCCKHCKYLNKSTNLCKVYNKRPYFCYKEFPIDKLDQKIWNVKKCGYKFD